MNHFTRIYSFSNYLIFGKILADIRYIISSLTTVNKTGVKLTTSILISNGKFMADVNDIAGHIFPEIYIYQGDTTDKFAIPMMPAVPW